MVEDGRTNNTNAQHDSDDSDQSDSFDESEFSDISWSDLSWSDNETSDGFITSDSEMYGPEKWPESVNSSECSSDTDWCSSDLNMSS